MTAEQECSGRMKTKYLFNIIWTDKQIYDVMGTNKDDSIWKM